MADEESSPWEGNSPSYKAVPSLNPKTQEPIQLYACTDCGAAVISRKIHSQWHRDATMRRSWP